MKTVNFSEIISNLFAQVCLYLQTKLDIFHKLQASVSTLQFG